MGLMDKVKAQATQIAEKAQEAGKVGQAKLEGVQAKRKADSLLEELGRITYDAHEGRGAPGGEQRASDLIEQLHQYEAEYGPLSGDAAPASGANGAATAPPGAAPTASADPVPTPVPEPVPTAASEPAEASVPSQAASTVTATTGNGGLPEGSSFGDGEL